MEYFSEDRLSRTAEAQIGDYMFDTEIDNLLLERSLHICKLKANEGNMILEEAFKIRYEKDDPALLHDFNLYDFDFDKELSAVHKLQEFV